VPEGITATCSYCGHPMETPVGSDHVECRVHALEDALAHLGTVITGQLRHLPPSSDPVAFQAFSEFQSWAVQVQASRSERS
jgi:hypothetical protein